MVVKMGIWDRKRGSWGGVGSVWVLGYRLII